MELSVIALTFVASVGLGLAGSYAMLSNVILVTQRAAVRAADRSGQRRG